MQHFILLSEASCGGVNAQVNSLVHYIIYASDLFQSTTLIFKDNAFLDPERGLYISNLALILPAKRYRGRGPSLAKKTQKTKKPLSLLSRVLIGSLIKPPTTFLLELQQCYIRNGIGTSLFAVNGLP